MSNENIQQLQIIEQNLQSFLMQKQQLQQEVFEIDSALKELETTEESYKIVGSVMVSAKKDDLVKDLNSQKEEIALRLDVLQQQEDKIKEKAESLRKDAMEDLNKE